MNDELRSQLLSQFDRSLKQPVLLRLASERSIRDAFGSDPDYDLPTLVVAEERPLREDGDVERETLTRGAP
ncbi:MAG TPA: hypothetical protein VLF14_03380 [Candidatus Binatia bacterium]|nr:hypothetical protein [Candidatus Binatia bacterium]